MSGKHRNSKPDNLPGYLLVPAEACGATPGSLVAILALKPKSSLSKNEDQLV